MTHPLLIAQYLLSRKLGVFLAVSAMLLILSCDLDDNTTIPQNEDTTISQEPIVNTPVPEQVIDPDLGYRTLVLDKSRELAPPVSEDTIAQVVQGNSVLALALYETWRNDEQNANKNYFVSPYSISSAFSMVYGGARGNTASEMAAVLRFDSVAPTDLFAAFNALDLALTATPNNDGVGTAFTLNIANAVWGQQDFPFSSDYIDLLAINYGAFLRVLDMSASVPAEQSRQVINDWVSEKTADRIKDLLPKNSLDDAKLVITNAVYFNASWANAFDMNMTADAPFNLASGETISVSTMQKTLLLSYMSTPIYEAVRLPYKGNRIVMDLFVSTIGGFENFASSLLDEEDLDPLASASKKRVALFLPKFNADTVLNLKDQLQILGVHDLFNSTLADLSGTALPPPRLFVASAFHQAAITVDEKGTEAVAATTVIYGETSVLDLVELHVDRPFLFFIRDVETGTVLFMGSILNPLGE